MNNKEGLMKFETTKELKKYVRRILMRGFYQFKFQEEDDTVYCFANCTVDAFKRISQRAECERLSEIDDVLYMTEAEAQNVALQHELLRMYNKKAFCILKEAVTH